jgi:hypothetical protein
VNVVHRRLVIGRNSQTAPLSGSYFQTLLDMFPVVPKYFRLLWGVSPFQIDYNYMKGGFSIMSPLVWSGLLLLALLAAAGFFAWRKPQFRPVTFGLIWTGLFFLPVSNLLPMMQYMAERFIYLPVIGWLIAAATIVATLPRQKIVRPCLTAALLVWSFSAWQRSWIWKDEFTLFVTSYLECPPSLRLEHNAAQAIRRLPAISRVFTRDDASGQNRILPSSDLTAQREALETYERAVKIMPESTMLLAGYGTLLGNLGRTNEGILIFEKVVARRPDNCFNWINLASGYLVTGQIDRARVAAEQAIERAPINPIMWKFKTDLEWQTGNYEAARVAARRWGELAPSDETARRLVEIEKKISERVQPLSR